MSFAGFCKVDGIDGDSQDSGHQNWITVLSYRHAVAQSGGTDVGATTGHAGGRPEFDDFTIVKHLDKSSPHLAQFCASGKSIPKVVIELAASNQTQQVYMKYTLSKVIVAGCRPGGSANDKNMDRPLEEVNFRYSQIEWEFTPWKDDGTKGSPQKTNWNVATGKAG